MHYAGSLINLFFFFFNDTATTEIYTLSLHDALPISLQAFLTGTREARRRRGEQMVGKLQELGVAIALADVEEQAGGGAVGRPHVARALVERGGSADINEAVERFLRRGRAAFVEKPLPALAGG